MTVHRLIKRGQIPPEAVLKVGTAVRIDRQAAIAALTKK